MGLPIANGRLPIVQNRRSGLQSRDREGAVNARRHTKNAPLPYGRGSVGGHRRKDQSRDREGAVKRARTALAILLLPLVFSGCGNGGQSPPGSSKTPEVTRTASDGPVTLILTARPAELPFNERAEVIVEVLAEKGVTVDIEEYDRNDSFSEHSFEYRVTPLQRKTAMPTDDGKLRWTHRYAIEFFLPGSYELPPAVVSFVDSREASDSTTPAQVHELETEPLTIVARDSNSTPLTPEELRTITALPPVELREPWSRWWWTVPLLALGIALLAARIRRMRSRPLVTTPIPAHEWARRAIAALIGENLIATGRVQEFYYRISDIVRGYVERRFGVSAPEMTTEEFLAAAAADGRFGQRNTTELNVFLNACDLVKYARQIPGAVSADAVLRAAGGFVERTRESLYRSGEEGSPPMPTMERAA